MNEQETMDSLIATETPPVNIAATDAALPSSTEVLLEKIPKSQRTAAEALLTHYGHRLLGMAVEEAWSYIRRLMAGDLDAVSELDAMMSDEEFLAKVRANTARWEGVAQYNLVRATIRNEILIKMAPVVLTILLALVGL